MSMFLSFLMLFSFLISLHPLFFLHRPLQASVSSLPYFFSGLSPPAWSLSSSVTSISYMPDVLLCLSETTAKEEICLMSCYLRDDARSNKMLNISADARDALVVKPLGFNVLNSFRYFSSKPQVKHPLAKGQQKLLV